MTRRSARKRGSQNSVLWVIAVVGVIASLVAAVLIVQRRAPVGLGISPLSIVSGNRIFPTRIDSPVTLGDSSEIHTEDFNGDGFTDVATLHAALGSGDVTILLGDGFGNFIEDPAAPYAVGGFVTQLTAANLNPTQDAHTDLITADVLGDAVTILMGNGDGTFTPGTPLAFAGGSFPAGTAVADFTGDGTPDLAVSLASTSMVEIFPGVGDGTFGAPTSSASGGAFPYYLKADRANGDAHYDVVSANSASEDVSVLLGDGAGSLSAAAGSPFALPVGSAPESLGVGDLNADGILDVVTANKGLSSLSALFGTGTGALGAPVSIPVAAAPGFVAIGDLDSDTIPDLVSGSTSVAAFSRVINNGDGTFAAAQNYYPNTLSYGVSITQLNEDSVPDVLTFNTGGTTGTLSAFFGVGDGTFENAINYAAAGTGASVEHADLNGDGNLDLVVADESDGDVQVLLGNGDATFGAPTSFATDSVASELELGDLNGDGDLDVVTLDFSSTSFSILLGNGDGTFGTAATTGLGSFPQGLTLNDFNNDNDLDVAIANTNDLEIVFYPGNGDGTLGAPSTVYSSGLTADSPYRLASGDLNGDGDMDIVTSLISDSGVSVILGNGDGTFGSPTEHAAGSGSAGLELADFTGDGVLDAVTGDIGSKEVSVLPGNGSGGFGSAVSYSVDEAAYFIAAEDFDDDGNLDIAAPNHGEAWVNVLMGNGDGTFEGPTRYFGGGGFGITAADFNNNPKPEVVTTNFTGTVTVYLNAFSPAGLVIEESGGSTSIVEGGAADTYTVRLSSRPESNVTVTLQVDSPLSASPVSLVFTPSNWNIPQTVSVSAPNDGTDQGSRSLMIRHSTSSSDPFYDSLPLTDVTVLLSDNIIRIAEIDPVALAIRISEENFANAQDAEGLVLARSDIVVDSFTVTPFASLLDATLLLTPSSGLPQNVLDEIARALGPGSLNKPIYLAGGTEALSLQVNQDLIDAGYTTIERFDGEDRRHTARLIGDEIIKLNPEPTDRAFLAEDRAFADALGAGGVAGNKADGKVDPILISGRSNAQLDSNVGDFLDAHPEITSLELIGGGTALPLELDTSIPADHPSIATLSRVAGLNRFATNRELNDKYYPSPSTVVVANGQESALPGAASVDAQSVTGASFFAALLGGRFAAQNQAPLLISKTTELTQPIVDYMVEHPTIDLVYIIGSLDLISQATEDQIKTLLQ